MAGYTEYDKIAEMAGIPSVISEEINRFMNDMNPPKEFEDHNAESKIFVCGHLNVSMRTLMGSENDRGKKEWVQKEDLKWLLATRKEYISCYYLHLAVDNICENKDRIKDSKETIDNCINSWGKNRAVVVPGTEPYLRDVLGFLMSKMSERLFFIIQIADEYFKSVNELTVDRPQIVQHIRVIGQSERKIFQDESCLL